MTHLQELFLSDWKASKGSALFTSSEQVLQGASRCPVSGAWSLQRVAIDTLRLCTVVVPRLGIHRHAMPSSLHPHCHVGENPRVPQEPGFQPSPVTKTHSSEQTTMPAPYVLLGSCLVQLNHRYLAYPLSTPTPGHLGFFFPKLTSNPVCQEAAQLPPVSEVSLPLKMHENWWTRKSSCHSSPVPSTHVQTRELTRTVINTSIPMKTMS